VAAFRFGNGRTASSTGSATWATCKKRKLKESLAKALAEIAIQEAIARTGNASKINNAQTELNKGDDEAGRDHPDKAIDHYKNSWKSAIAA
jgi:hypothetical protein